MYDHLFSNFFFSGSERSEEFNGFAMMMLFFFLSILLRVEKIQRSLRMTQISRSKYCKDGTVCWTFFDEIKRNIFPAKKRQRNT